MIALENYEKSLKRLESWFKKTLTEDQAEILYSQVMFIPGEPFEAITNKIIESKAPNPGNFPTSKEIKFEWYIWKKDNPHKVVVDHEETDCDDCYGTGFLWFRQTVLVTNLKTEHCCRCAMCKNWKPDIHADLMPVYSREYLESLGLELWPYWKYVDPERFKGGDKGGTIKQSNS